MGIIIATYRSLGAMEDAKRALGRQYGHHAQAANRPPLTDLLTKSKTDQLVISQEAIDSFASYTGTHLSDVRINGEWQFHRHDDPPRPLLFSIQAPRNDSELLARADALEKAGSLYADWQRKKPDLDAKMLFENTLLDAGGATLTGAEACMMITQPVKIFQALQETQHQQKEVQAGLYRSMYRLLLRTIIAYTPSVPEIRIGPTLAQADHELRTPETSVLSGVLPLEECLKKLPGDVLHAMIMQER